MNESSNEDLNEISNEDLNRNSNNSDSINNENVNKNQTHSNQESVYNVDFDISFVQDEINEIHSELKTVTFSNIIKLAPDCNNSNLELDNNLQELVDNEACDLDGQEVIKELKINLGV